MRGVGCPSSRSRQVGKVIPTVAAPREFFDAAGMSPSAGGSQGRDIPTILHGFLPQRQGTHDCCTRSWLGDLTVSATRSALPAIHPDWEGPVGPFCRYPAPYRAIAQFVGSISIAQGIAITIGVGVVRI
jgi:hypothetical protein